MAAGADEKIRTLIVLSFLLIWAVVSAAHVLYGSVIERDGLLAASRKMAWRNMTAPCLRGNILDRDGAPLATTEIEYEFVFYGFPKRPARRANLAALLKKKLGASPPEVYSDGKKSAVVLKSRLTPEEVVDFSREFAKYPETAVLAKFKRVVHGGKNIAVAVGETASNDAGELVGVSGAEREFDFELAGRQGLISVMLDRYGNWCPGTEKIIRKSRNGRDVRLRYTVSELSGTDGK